MSFETSEMILLYHKVSQSHKTLWYVRGSVFRAQMERLRKKGRKVVHLDEYDPHDPKQVVITFDGGYAEMADVAVPILNEFGYPYEVFVIGAHIGGDNRFDTVEPFEKFLSSEQLAALVKTGLCRLQWHSLTHPHAVDVTDRAAWLRELEVPEAVRALDPKGFTWFAYPYGDTLDWQIEEVRQRFSGALVISGGDIADPYRQERRIVYEETDVVRGMIRFHTRVILHLKVRTFPAWRRFLTHLFSSEKGIAK